MAKQVIAFDLDGTLAESKSAMTDRMSELLSELLDNYQVCVISGGKFAQFDKQLISNLKVTPNELKNLHLMPTCGTRYDRYDFDKQEWSEIYAENFEDSEKEAIIQVLKEGAKELNLWEENPWGDIIEDRGSQITFSALGQEAPVDAKHEWDPTGEKKAKLRDYAAAKLEGFEVRTGGTTSVDITREGIDKAYGMKKLMEELDVKMEDILFFGDALHEGGNDYPVKAMGIDCVAVRGWEDTAVGVESILKLGK